MKTNFFFNSAFEVQKELKKGKKIFCENDMYYFQTNGVRYYIKEKAIRVLQESNLIDNNFNLQNYESG